nr:hypothetical protein BgiMline_012204 [Biomphalaria glabrata]
MVIIKRHRSTNTHEHGWQQEETDSPKDFDPVSPFLFKIKLSVPILKLTYNGLVTCHDVCSQRVLLVDLDVFIFSSFQKSGLRLTLVLS